MASIGNDRNGRRRVLFVAADGSRRTVRLGKCSRRDAEHVCRHIEALLASSIHGQPVPRETATWLSNIGSTLYDRLARAKLVEPRAKAVRQTVAGFIDDYIAERRDLKPATLTLLRQARIWLVRYLGETRRMDQVSVADADGYRAHMIAKGLAKATIAKRCRYARHFFDVAQRRGVVASNPFDHIKDVVKSNPKRRVFVPGDVVAKVIEVAQDPQWKLLIALARWGGLRIPSEALRLTWADVDFLNNRFIVRATKTEAHADGGVRVVPMFPELAPLFQAVFDQAEEGEVHVITRYRSSAVNLRTQFLRLIERAGVRPWPKLWQNLRASRATELADQFPSHVCASWLGHTEAVADAFYRSVTDEHFLRATTPTQEALKAAQNPAQQVRAPGRKVSQVETDDSRNPMSCGGLREGAGGCGMPNKSQVGDEGLEPTTPAM